MSGVAMPSLYGNMIYRSEPLVLTPQYLHNQMVIVSIIPHVYSVEITGRSAVLSENEKKRFAACPAQRYAGEAPSILFTLTTRQATQR